MASFRKSKSVWVVYGSVEEVRVGKVAVNRKDRSVRNVDVVSLGRPFRAEGRMMVYGYLGEAKTAAAPARTPEPVHYGFGSPVVSAMDWMRETGAHRDVDYACGEETDGEMAF